MVQIFPMVNLLHKDGFDEHFIIQIFMDDIFTLFDFSYYKRNFKPHCKKIYILRT